MERFERTAAAGVAMVAVLSSACLWAFTRGGPALTPSTDVLVSSFAPAGDEEAAGHRWGSLAGGQLVPPLPAGMAVSHGPRDRSAVALVFDADMTPGMLWQLKEGRVRSWYDRRIVQTLVRERVPATIFLTGLWAETYPAEARAIASDPLFEVGDHTYDHAAFRIPCYGLPLARDKFAEISRAQQAIRTAGGVVPRLLRFPGDCYSAADLGVAKKYGLAVISPDVKGADAFVRDPRVVASVVLERTAPGSIIGLHLQGAPNAPATADALLLIIRAVRARGLHFVTVTGLFSGTTAVTMGRQPRPDAAQTYTACNRPRARTVL